MKHTTVPLRDLVVLNDAGVWGPEDLDYGISVLRSTNFNSDGSIRFENLSFRGIEQRKRITKRLAPNDILLEKSGGGPKQPVGRVCLYRGHHIEHVFGNFTARLRANETVANPEYLYWCLRYLHLSGGTEKYQRHTSGIRNLEIKRYLSHPIPLPTLSEQQRIVGILNRAAKIERMRAQAQERLREIIPALFIKMFGDPVRNPYGYDQQTLSECANFISGATPSKQNGSYWNGEIPWISPKDMKVDLIFDSDDHVSKLAFADTNLKAVPANTPLIVIRGMILAHTVPIALTARTVAINQDMKAINFDSAINPVFGFWCLKVLQQRILADVDTAAHGTKRIEMSRLGDIPIHIPSSDQQRRYVQLVERVRAAIAVAESRFGTISELTSCLMSGLLADDR